MAAAFQLDEERLRRLTERLLSAAVQVPEAAELQDVPATLESAEVEQVFRDHVAGVEGFLFRGKCPALGFMVSAYQEGLQAFLGTPVHGHLRSLLRLVVHHSRAGGVGSAENLREVAEGFMDCQAVQARTIERVGLRVCGAVPGFKGLVMRLVGEYKALAIRMLAQDRLTAGLAKDYDAVHTHYENRLTADLGQRLGLDADSVRLAAYDGHAARRFGCFVGADADAASARCRELFDSIALLQAFVAEVNSLSEESAPESLARLFVSWVDENLADKHAIFDKDTCSRTEIDMPLALCIFEALFLEVPMSKEGMYCGPRQSCQESNCQRAEECNSSAGDEQAVAAGWASGPPL